MQLFLDQFRLLGFGPIIDDLTPTDIKTDFFGMGVNIDLGEWFLAGEYIRGPDPNVENIIYSKTKSWYMKVGRRFGPFTAHATYVQEKADLSAFNDLSAATGISLESLRQNLDYVIDEGNVKNLILGLRYDWNTNTALKFEMDHVELTEPKRNGTLYSFSIDIVF